MARYWRCDVCGKEYSTKVDAALQIVVIDQLREFDSKACVNTFIESLTIKDLAASVTADPAPVVKK